MSLKTDSRQLAEKKAPAVWDSLVAGWEAQLAGKSDAGTARFEAARAIAASHGLTYKPIRDVEELPLEELLARVELLQRRDGTVNLAAAPGVLGLIEVPSMTVSAALTVNGGAKTCHVAAQNQASGGAPSAMARALPG